MHIQTDHLDVGTALITGAAKRIGREIAISLAREGYNIALHYRNSFEEADKTLQEIKDIGVDCKIYQADLTVKEELLSLISTVFADYKDLNVLVNCASLFQRSPMQETSYDLFSEMQNINFKAPFFLSRDFSNICRRGNIINILDTNISTSQYVYSAYLLGKKALAEFTRMAAKELAPFFRVNGICPGLILPSEKENEEYIKSLSRKIPLGNIGKPEHISHTVDFLLNNNFITGQIIFVDGGENLK